jgi:hypothetical protein
MLKIFWLNGFFLKKKEEILKFGALPISTVGIIEKLH